MTKCKYCDQEYKKGIKMHERHCKQNPEKILQSSKNDPEGTFSPNLSNTPLNPPSDDIISSERTNLKSIELDLMTKHPPVEPKPKSRNGIYYTLVIIFILAGILQGFLITYLKMSLIFLAIFYIIDIIILLFLIWTIYRLRKKEEPVIFEDIEDFVKKVPKWAIETKSPKSGLIGALLNRDKDYKQLVFVSENFEPKAVWAVWDGFLFRIGNRAYKPARDVRGDLFFYHVDKKMPLIDSANATAEDAEDSFHELALWNQAFSVGHAAALTESQNQIKLTLIISAITLLAVIILAIYIYGQFDEITSKLGIIERQISQIPTQGAKS